MTNNNNKTLFDSINQKRQFIQNDSKLNTRLIKMTKNLIKMTLKIVID